MLENFLDYLGQITERKAVKKPKSREFIDIMARVHPNAIEIPAPNIPSSYMPPLQFTHNLNPLDKARISGCWMELNKITTERLVLNCKQHGGTIQGAIQAAFMVAMCKEQEKQYPLPQIIVNMAPINMRPYVDPPLEAQDCVSGSAGLIWAQAIASTQPLWSIVKEATEKLRHEIEIKRGLRWWKALEAKEPQIPPTFMASSIGKTPLGTSYGPIRLLGVKIIGGGYDNPRIGQAGTMLHAYTIQQRLNLTFAFTFPPIAYEWGSRFLDKIVAILRCLASEKGNEALVVDFL